MIKFRVGDIVARNPYFDTGDGKCFPDEALKEKGIVSKLVLEVNTDGTESLWTYVRWQGGKIYSYKGSELLIIPEANDLLKDLL